MSDQRDLILDTIGIEFSGTAALSEVSVRIRPGEIHAVMGENGAGKSTLLKIAAGVIPVGSFRGVVRWRGAPVSFRSVRDAQDAGIVLIHQELALVPEMTVAENISLGREPVVFGVIDRDAQKQVAQEALHELGIPIDVERKVRDLGVGLCQVVEIAKALSREFELLILDEPTAALSYYETDQLLTLLSELAQRGKAIVYVSHRLREVLSIASTVSVLRDGRKVIELPRAECSEEVLISHMVGRPVSGAGVRHPAKGEQIALRVAGMEPLAHRRAESAAQKLAPISFEARRGEILGIAGLVGAGRSELLETIFGVRRGTSGTEMELFGHSYIPGSPTDAIQAGVALVSEDRKRTGVVLDHSIAHNASLVALRSLCRWGVVNKAREREMVATKVDSVGTRYRSLNQPVRTLSGGNQQKVVFAKWLLSEPQVLLLDEPTRGVDVGAKEEIHDLIRFLASRGCAVVLATSDLPELLKLSDTVIVLSDGGSAGTFPNSGLTEELLMQRMTAAFSTEEQRSYG